MIAQGNDSRANIMEDLTEPKPSFLDAAFDILMNVRKVYNSARILDIQHYL